MECVTPSDVNDAMLHVRVETPTRTFFFNEKGDADIPLEIYQVGVDSLVLGGYGSDVKKDHFQTQYTE